MGRSRQPVYGRPERRHRRRYGALRGGIGNRQRPGQGRGRHSDHHLERNCHFL